MRCRRQSTRCGRTRRSRTAQLLSGGPAALIPYVHLLNGICNIDYGSGANIDNLPQTTMSCEGWLRITRGPNTLSRNIIHKLPFTWKVHLGGIFRIQITTTGASARCDSSVGVIDGLWHHWMVTFTAATRFFTIWRDGVDVTVNRATGSGVPNPDAANNLIQVANTEWSVDAGWFGYSDNIRQAAPFTPNPRGVPPGNDANYQLLIPMNEGAGGTAADISGNGYDGTITNGVWRAD